MRLIFLFLLLANIALFAYVKLMPTEPPVSAPTIIAEPENNLELLSERGGSAAPSSIKNTQPSGAAASLASSQASGKDELCTMVGPYSKLLHAEYLVERLAALGVKSQVTNVEIKDGEAYWVYLPPELSEKEALRRLYELQGKNIESYIITKGDLANGISFGRYSDQLAAESRANELSTKGYEAKIKAVPKTINETWVLLEARGDEKISDSAWAELLSQQQNLEKRQNFCLSVASQ